MTPDSSETNRLLRAAPDDPAELGRLLQRHRERLRAVVAFRLDPRLQGRVEPSDVLQEVCLAAAQSLDDYRKQPEASFFLWLRGIAVNKLLELHRHHFGA